METDDTLSERRLSVRLTPEEKARIERLQERLQGRAGAYTRVTTRTVILEALDALTRYLDGLDRKR